MRASLEIDAVRTDVTPLWIDVFPLCLPPEGLMS